MIGVVVVATAFLLPGLLSADRARAAAPAVGPLRVSGNTLLDGNGVPLKLRGVDHEYLDAYPYLTGSALTDSEIGVMAQDGVNFLRVPLSETFAVPSACTNYHSDYLSLVDQVVASATSRGIVVDLDLHTNPGSVPCRNQQEALADSGSVTFWQTVAARYKNNGLVVFDLYNEPHVSTWSLWLSGGIDNTQPAQGQLVGMQALYNAVRGTGATNVVIASGNGWAALPPPPGDQIVGTNVVYGWHTYQCKASPCTGFSTAPDPAQVSAWTTLASSAPFLMTEFGWPENNQSGATFDQTVLTDVENLGGGWAAYQWGAFSSGTGSFGIVVDLQSNAPTVTGQPVFSALASGP